MAPWRCGLDVGQEVILFRGRMRPATVLGSELTCLWMQKSTQKPACDRPVLAPCVPHLPLRSSTKLSPASRQSFSTFSKSATCSSTFSESTASAPTTTKGAHSVRGLSSSAPVEKKLFGEAKRQFLLQKAKKFRAQYPVNFDLRKWGDPSVVYSTNADQIEQVLAGMTGPFGFDMEWDPFKGSRKTALIQVCDEKTVLLAHVAKMRRFPVSLKEFIEDPEKIKLGVNIAGDSHKLQRDFMFKMQGDLELNAVARKLDQERWSDVNSMISLQRLAGAYLGQYLKKDENVRCSAWGGNLTPSQKYYASNDVYSSLLIFRKMTELDPTFEPFTLVNSSTSPPVPSATPTTQSFSATKVGPRQLEAFALWSEGHDPERISAIMSQRRPIKAGSVVTYVFNVAARATVDYDDKKLWKLWTEGFGEDEFYRKFVWKDNADFMTAFESRMKNQVVTAEAMEEGKEGLSKEAVAPV